jgi:hypothetical protein
MKTLSVQQMPNGFELEVPSFGYWFKVGVAVMLGASLTALALIPLYVVVQIGFLTGMLRGFMR